MNPIDVGDILFSLKGWAFVDVEHSQKTYLVDMQHSQKTYVQFWWNDSLSTDAMWNPMVISKLDNGVYLVGSQNKCNFKTVCPVLITYWVFLYSNSCVSSFVRSLYYLSSVFLYSMKVNPYLFPQCLEYTVHFEFWNSGWSLLTLISERMGSVKTWLLNTIQNSFLVLLCSSGSFHLFQSPNWLQYYSCMSYKSFDELLC